MPSVNKSKTMIALIYYLLTAIAIVVIAEIHLMKLFNMDGSQANYRDVNYS